MAAKCPLRLPRPTARAMSDSPPSPQHNFTRTLVIVFLGWWLFICLYRFVAALLTYALFGSGLMMGNPSLGTSLYQALEGILLGLESAFPLQIALWWLWFRPQRHRWWLLGGLMAALWITRIIQFMLPNLGQWFSDSVADSYEYPSALLALWSLASALTVFAYMAAIHLASPLVRGRFLRKADDSGAEISHPRLEPGQYSITSLILMTTLAAVLMTVQSWTERLQADLFSDAGIPPFTGLSVLIGLAYRSLIIAATVAMLFFIAYRPNRSLASPVRWLPSLILSLTTVTLDLLYMRYLYPDSAATILSTDWVIGTAVRAFFWAATIDIVTRWFFRRWDNAGFDRVLSR